MYEAQIRVWKQEESFAHIHGWDFSHIDGRHAEPEELPWDYRQVISRYLRPDMRLLDMDTGGGEFLLSLKHPYANTAATENYEPNVALCAKTLLHLGIDFRPGSIPEGLPFPDEHFDILINRHGDLNPREFFRLLKPGGLFITQQVGADNERELIELLCPGTPVPFPEQHLAIQETAFRDAGFSILESGSSYRPIRFFDVGALVWFARVLPWEFPGFSVDTHLDRLLLAQQKLEADGFLEGSTHRFLLVAQK